MRTIEIEEDVYTHLVANTQELEEPTSSILRRLLGLKAPSENGKQDLNDETLSEQSQRLLSFAGDRLGFGNVTRKYMRLLEFLHEENPTTFDAVLKIQGRTRRYFGRSRSEIASCGTSTHPKPISNSPYWALTNADTYHKREILRRVLNLLGYERRAVQMAAAALR